MPTIIQTRQGLGDYTQSGVVLDNKPYNIRLRWNAIDAAWYMDVREQDDSPIVSGAKLVLGVYVGRQSTHDLFLRGAFFLVDTANTDGTKGREATFDDLGTRVVLSYWLHNEILADMLKGSTDRPIGGGVL